MCFWLVLAGLSGAAAYYGWRVWRGWKILQDRDDIDWMGQ